MPRVLKPLRGTWSRNTRINLQKGTKRTKAADLLTTEPKFGFPTPMDTDPELKPLIDADFLQEETKGTESETTNPE